jgi:hypothetical protein
MTTNSRKIPALEIYVIRRMVKQSISVRRCGLSERARGMLDAAWILALWGADGPRQATEWAAERGTL